MKLVKVALGLLVAIGIAVVGWYWYKKREAFAESTISIAEGEKLFRTAVFANHEAEGIPYWIFKVLPDMFPEVYEPGYANIHFNQEPGSDLPLGYNKSVHDGIPFVTHNCASCHAGTYRLTPEGDAVSVMGMPAVSFRRDVFDQGWHKAFTSERFQPATVLKAIEARTTLTEQERQAHARWVQKLRDRTATLLKELGTTRGAHPQIMPGAGEGFGAAKAYAGIFDSTIGTADFPSTWEQGKRAIGHWDGISTSTLERVVGSALAIGVPGPQIDMRQMLDLDHYTSKLAPPPFAGQVDSVAAARGADVFQAQCAQCHAAGGRRINTIVPAREVGTDPHRQESITFSFIWLLKLGTLPQKYPFQHWQTSNGYRSDFLEGLWLRGPYLHNGSVPTIRDLLKPPSERPVTFWRGTNVVDLENVGFRSDKATAGNEFQYDTRQPGYSKEGHEYGTALSEAAKNALVEFLKTL